ncbi:hypothetical protein Slin15195_G037700 [Septoria linicola]|uniref:Uncharacterized protein n=1 Tax=Septoria linicola TaxID=215465 RepID=A0A9Q9AQZ1_9PEZI|nr:hypothetical protein Slin15195_G037700 [Septoria linicola]
MTRGRVSEAIAIAESLNETDFRTFCKTLRRRRQPNNMLLTIPRELRDRIWELALLADIRDQCPKPPESKVEIVLPAGLPGIVQDVRMDVAAMAYNLSAFMPKPPAFVDTCRQIKVETQATLYSSIMIWEEWHGRSGSKTVLQPYQMGSLFNTRKHGLPLLKCRPMRFGEKDVPEASLLKGVKRGARYGLVRCDAELDLEAMRWCVQLWRQPGSDIGVEEVE